jgi:hypothetical protein
MVIVEKSRYIVAGNAMWSGELFPFEPRGLQISVGRIKGVEYGSKRKAVTA